MTIDGGLRPGQWFHYCCDHSVRDITRAGWVKPMVGHPYLNGARISWFTDLDVPDRDGLGLTSDTIQCDRMAWRVTVEGAVWWWPDWARQHRVSREVRDVLESFGRPAHWFVTDAPLSVLSIAAVERVA